MVIRSNSQGRNSSPAPARENIRDGVSDLPVVSFNRIVERHPEQYVLVDNCRFDHRGEVTAGRVLANSKDRDQIYSGLTAFPNSIILFTGPDADTLEGAFLDSGRTWVRRAKAQDMSF